MMDELQKVYDSSMERIFSEQLTIERMIALACLMKLRQPAGAYTDGALSAVSGCVTTRGDNTFEVDPTTEVVAQLGVSKTEFETAVARLNLRDLKRATKLLHSAASSTAGRFIEELGEDFLGRFRDAKTNVLQTLGREHRAFSQRLHRDWKQALDDFFVLTWLCRETGSSVNVAIRSTVKPARRQFIETLTRLHARACQIALEVHLLLTNGFADGAHARWRTLYEIGIVSDFIGRHGRTAARLYNAHQVVGLKRQADAYNRAAKARGLKALEPRRYQKIMRQYASAERRYGKVFVRDYGWAAVTLKQGTPATFSEFITEVDQDRLRDHYATASDNVHATPVGLYYRLGLHETQDDILLAGPSNLGLDHVLTAAAESLIVVTQVVGRLAPNLDRAFAQHAMRELLEGIAVHSQRSHETIIERGAAAAYVLRDAENQV